MLEQLRPPTATDPADWCVIVTVAVNFPAVVVQRFVFSPNLSIFSC
jgi:hypothetical protein